MKNSSTFGYKKSMESFFFLNVHDTEFCIDFKMKQHLLKVSFSFILFADFC